LDKPSNSRLWEEAEVWLKEAAIRGHHNEWKDGGHITVKYLESEFWEALRVVGDSEEGFGTFP
jgi:hypothetical protein